MMMAGLVRRSVVTASSVVRAAHRLSSAAAAPPPAGAPRIMRFVSDDGAEEHWGAFSNPQETEAFVARRGATGRLALTEERLPVTMVLPPVDPAQVICIGLNYRDHATEVKMDAPRNPIVFFKGVNALIGHGGAIVIPRVAADECDYEAELAVVIGRAAKNVSEADAMDYVLGYTVANDVTARRWQGLKGGNQWARGKSFDTFLPLGPAVTPRDAVDLADTRIRTWVNGVLCQDGNTADMIHKVPKLIAFLSQGTTLLPGSVILTGTPAGVGYTRGVYLQPGDNVRIKIDGVGELRNPVVADEGSGGGDGAATA